MEQGRDIRIRYASKNETAVINNSKMIIKNIVPAETFTTNDRKRATMIGAFYRIYKLTREEREDIYDDLKTSILLKAREFYIHGYTHTLINQAIKIVARTHQYDTRFRTILFIPTSPNPIITIKQYPGI